MGVDGDRAGVMAVGRQVDMSGGLGSGWVLLLRSQLLPLPLLAVLPAPAHPPVCTPSASPIHPTLPRSDVALDPMGEIEGGVRHLSCLPGGANCKLLGVLVFGWVSDEPAVHCLLKQPKVQGMRC